MSVVGNFNREKPIKLEMLSKRGGPAVFRGDLRVDASVRKVFYRFIVDGKANSPFQIDLAMHVVVKKPKKTVSVNFRGAQKRYTEEWWVVRDGPPGGGGVSGTRRLP